jgi:hypothetical protein
VTDRTGLSRGDRNRNARLARLRELLPAGNAIVGIDLAAEKQAAVVTDHDSRVLARRRGGRAGLPRRQRHARQLRHIGQRPAAATQRCSR